MVKLIELIDDFQLNQRIEGKKHFYIKVCMSRLTKWRIYLEQEFQINDLESVKPAHIKSFIQTCQGTGREINSTINGSIATLRVFFNLLVEEEYLSEHENPMRRIKNLKEDKKVILTFNDEEVSRILNDVEEATYSNIRDKLILIFLFDSGIRVSELCDIRTNDVSRKHIFIHGKGSKQRLIYISKLMRKYMRKFEAIKKERFNHRLDDEIGEHYFLDQSAERLSRSRINQILKEHSRRVGVRKEVRCSPHDCRYYYAQKQIKNGIDVICGSDKRSKAPCKMYLSKLYDAKLYYNIVDS